MIIMASYQCYTSEKIISLDDNGSAEFSSCEQDMFVFRKKMIHLYFQISLHFINLRKVS